MPQQQKPEKGELATVEGMPRLLSYSFSFSRRLRCEHFFNHLVLQVYRTFVYTTVQCRRYNCRMHYYNP